MSLGFDDGSTSESIAAVKKKQVILYQTGVYFERHEESRGIFGLIFKNRR
jgi:hypothetical protein